MYMAGLTLAILMPMTHCESVCGSSEQRYLMYLQLLVWRCGCFTAKHQSVGALYFFFHPTP